jgi:hypothetical protein
VIESWRFSTSFHPASPVRAVRSVDATMSVKHRAFEGGKDVDPVPAEIVEHSDGVVDPLLA